MGKSGKKRRKKTIGYNHLGMFGISLIVLILIRSEEHTSLGLVKENEIIFQEEK